MIRRIVNAALIGMVWAAALCLGACRTIPSEVDLLIRGGRIVDGSGKAPFRGDVGIIDGRIAAVGDLSATKGRTVIEAAGKIVAPGFIDVHSHAERGLLRFPDCQNKLRQGVTTIVGGNCGASPYPIGDYFRKARRKGIALNLALLVGHNTVRRRVMGTENRPARASEIREMEVLVRRAMAEGAVGLSTGLKYIPGAYSRTEEVVALAAVVGRHGGVYATHMRDEGRELLEALEESIRIGTEGKVRVQISHHKVVGKDMWGASGKTLRMIDEAARAGLEITADQYPYTATSTGFTIVFPAWSLEGGSDELKKRLDDPAARKKIKDGIVFNIVHDRGGGDPASIVVASYTAEPSLNGKNLAEITRMRGLDPTPENAAETLMDLQYRSRGSAVYHCLHEKDLRRIMRHPRVMHASDGSTFKFGTAMPHPRNYGTFPRVLGRYVRDEKVIPLEEAVRKMTSLPAETFRLKDRGRLKEGYWADLVVFDPETVADRATWTQPHQYPVGIGHVVVNGKIVIEGDDRTKAFPGKALSGPGLKN